jgi:hypothetical protein
MTKLVDNPNKAELIRRLRLNALLRLFRHRWGKVLPDDDAGRGDLWELVCNASLAQSGADKKMRHVVELWAPWMGPDEVPEYIDHVSRLTIYERTPTAEQLGDRLRVTAALRERLKLWPIKPVDATAEDLVEQRKARRREQDRARRRKRGQQSRADYLSRFGKSLAKLKPWEIEGVSRRTWFRRLSKVAPGSPQTIVLMSDVNPVSPSARRRARLLKGGARATPKGMQGNRVKTLNQTTEAEKMQKTPSSRRVDANPVSPSPDAEAHGAREMAETERRWDERAEDFLNMPMTARPQVKALVNARLARAARIATHARAAIH